MLHNWKKSAESKVRAKKDITREKRVMKRWTADEVDYVIKNYHKMTQKEIAEALNTTAPSVARVVLEARRDGRLVVKKRRELTNEDISFIKENIGVMSVNQIAKKLGRHHAVISRCLDRMEMEGVDVTGARQREWTEEEHNYIIANYHKKARKEIARDLGVSPEDISNRIKVLMRRGLLKKRKSPRFTEEEIEYIKENKDALSGSEIARRLGRSHTNVIKYIREMEGR